MLLPGSAAAQSRDSANWVGAWGFVPTPLPPGITPPIPAAPVSEVVPLGVAATVAPAAAPPPAPAPLLIDNPGNIPVVPMPATDLVNTTVRQMVRVSAAGKQLRLRLSNEAGSEPLELGSVQVGLAGQDCTTSPATTHPVTFGGQRRVVVPASAPVLSDPVALPVNALGKLCISIHVPGALPRVGHSVYQYVAEGGDQTIAPQLSGVRLMRLPALVTQVQVDAERGTGVIVTLGDSITEGAASTNNAFRGWPDRLAERLQADRSGRNWAVVNAGIGGNRLLRYGTGPNALARLDRDVLSVPGVKALILLEGINDIGRGFTTVGPQEPVTVEALIAADQQIIARAHAMGIKVYGALLTPYKGAGYASPEGEKVRTALNTWILSSGAFDGVIDFATATGDPNDQLTFAPQYNDRDKLHPNDAGYQAMANAIDLKMVTSK